MRKCDYILGLQGNVKLFIRGETLTVSAYRTDFNWSRMVRFSKRGHTQLRAYRYSYIGPVRYAGGMLESRNYDYERSPSVGYRIRVKPKKSLCDDERSSTTKV